METDIALALGGDYLACLRGFFAGAEGFLRLGAGLLGVKRK